MAGRHAHGQTLFSFRSLVEYMPISFQCPDCDKPFNVDDKLAGKKARCGCGAVIRVPEAAAPAAQPAAPAQVPAPTQPVDPLMGSLPAGQQQAADPLMGSLPPMQQGGAAQQPLAPMNFSQQPSAAAGGGGKAGKTAIKVAVGAGGVAVLGAIVWLVISLLAGGAETHDKIADDMIGLTREMAEVFEGIDTVEDAKNAKGDLERINQDMRAINERAQAIGKPDEESKERLKKKIMDESMAIITPVIPKMMELQRDPEISEILEDVFSTPEQRVDWLD